MDQGGPTKKARQERDPVLSIVSNAKAPLLYCFNKCIHFIFTYILLFVMRRDAGAVSPNRAMDSI